MIRFPAFLTAAFFFANAAGAQGTVPLLGAGGTKPIGGGGGGCTEATTFLARTSGLNGTHTGAYTATICDLKTKSVWAKLDALWFTGTQDATTAGLNIISTNYTLTPHGSPNFSADNGYIGVDGSTTVYLDTGLNTSSAGGHYSTNTASYGVWSFTSSAAMANTPMGWYDGASSASQVFIRYTGDIYYGYVNNVLGTAQNSWTDTTGLFVVNRPNSATIDIYHNSSLVASQTNATNTNVNANVYLLARNNNGSPDIGGAWRIGMAFVAGALTSTDISDLYTSVCTNFFITLRGSC